MRTGVLLASIIVISAVGLLYGFAGLAAWADVRRDCPGGNQCSDARYVMWHGFGVATMCLALALAATRRIRRLRQTRQQGRRES